MGHFLTVPERGDRLLASHNKKKYYVIDASLVTLSNRAGWGIGLL